MRRHSDFEISLKALPPKHSYILHNGCISFMLFPFGRVGGDIHITALQDETHFQHEIGWEDLCYITWDVLFV